MILHIPHASTNTLGYEFLVNVEHELALLTDHDTDKLFVCDAATRLVFPVSRLVSDVERFEQE